MINRRDYEMGYNRALKDLEAVVDESEKLSDSELLEKLYHKILDLQAKR